MSASEASSAARPLLIYFYSAASGPSRRADGFLAQVLQRRGNHDSFRLLRVEANLHPRLAERYGVTKLPTLLVIDEGAIRARLDDVRGCIQVEKLLAPWLR